MKRELFTHQVPAKPIKLSALKQFIKSFKMSKVSSIYESIFCLKNPFTCDTLAHSLFMFVESTWQCTRKHRKTSFPHVLKLSNLKNAVFLLFSKVRVYFSTIKVFKRQRYFFQQTSIASTMNDFNSNLSFMKAHHASCDLFGFKENDFAFNNISNPLNFNSSNF